MGLRMGLAQWKLSRSFRINGVVMHRTCGNCGGKGVVSEPHCCYRVFSKYQDTGWIEPQEFPSLDQARLYKASNRDDSRMMQIVDPEGRVVN